MAGTLTYIVWDLLSVTLYEIAVRVLTTSVFYFSTAVAYVMMDALEDRLLEVGYDCDKSTMATAAVVCWFGYRAASAVLKLLL